MSITMFITRLIHVYITKLIHNFYNTNVAKKVTSTNLAHIFNTPLPQPKNYSYQAVSSLWEGLTLPTFFTSPTTTIFNKVENKIIILSNNLHLNHLQSNIC